TRPTPWSINRRMVSIRRLVWIIGCLAPPSMKKTTARAPWKTSSFWGHPPATKTGSTPGTSLRHLTSSLVPALNSWSPGPWLGRPAIRTILALASSAAAVEPAQPRAATASSPNSFFIGATSLGWDLRAKEKPGVFRDPGFRGADKRTNHLAPDPGAGRRSRVFRKKPGFLGRGRGVRSDQRRRAGPGQRRGGHGAPLELL